MPRYRFAGFHETVLMGLSHGVNAEVHRVGEDGDPVDFTPLAESTVVALPGDEITTAEPYENAWMTDLDGWATVGEHGPELYQDPDGVIVHTAERTAAAAAAGDLPNLVKPRKPRKPRNQTPPANQADPDSTSTSTDPEGEE